MTVPISTTINPRTGQPDTPQEYQPQTNIPLKITISGEPYLLVPVGDPPAKVYTAIFII